MSDKVINYEIIYGTAEDVTNQARKMLKDGWEPLGAPFQHGYSQLSPEGYPDYFMAIFQAMVKKRKPRW